jgi:ribose transport system permease protein
MTTSRLYWRLFWQRNRGTQFISAIALVFLVGYAILFPGLLRSDSIAKLSESWFPLAVVAMGQAIVLLTGGIDLSVGAMVNVGSVLSATVVTGSPFAIAGGIILVLLAGAIMGAITGLVVVLLRLPPIIVSLATSFIWSGVALTIMPTPGGELPDALSDAVAGELPVALLGLAILLVLWKAWALTPMGLTVYALGDNPDGAFRSGLNVAASKLACYAVSGILSALAGLFLGLQTGSGDPIIGTAYTLNSITAAVLGGVAFTGGVGTMRGVMAGSLLLTVMISVMFFLGISAFYQYIAQGVVIIIAVTLPLLRRA